MALIIGLKCSDGVVIASYGDATQRLTNRFAVAGIGSSAYIERATHAIEVEIGEARSRKGEVDLSEIECVDAIKNIDKSKLLGEQNLICGGVDATGKAYLLTVHRRGVVRIAAYTIAGSKLAYAYDLMANYYKSGITIDEAVPVATYIIDEVRRISRENTELKDTKVTVVDSDRGAREISKEEIARLEDYYRFQMRSRVLARLHGGSLRLRLRKRLRVLARLRGSSSVVTAPT